MAAYQIEFLLPEEFAINKANGYWNGRLRRVTVENGSPVRLAGAIDVELPAAQAAWDALSRVLGVQMLSERPEA